MSGDDIRRDPLDDEAVAAYVDGEMEPRERGRFEDRLAGDPTLAALVEEYRDMVELLHADRDAEEAMPPEFLVAVQRRIRLKSKGRFYGNARSRFPYETFGVLAVILVLLFAGFDVLFPEKTSLTLTATHRVILAAPVPELVQQDLGLEALQLPGAEASGWSLVLNQGNLDAARAQLLPLLESADQEWLAGLTLEEGQSVRLYLLPGGVDFLPAAMRFRVAPDDGAEDP